MSSDQKIEFSIHGNGETAESRLELEIAYSMEYGRDNRLLYISVGDGYEGGYIHVDVEKAKMIMAKIQEWVALQEGEGK